MIMSAKYEIHIKGHLDTDWMEWFAGFTFTHQPDGTTLLKGLVSDQPALYGLLMRINQLGLSLLRVEQMNMEVHDDE